MDYVAVARQYITKHRNQDTLDAVLKGQALGLVLDATGERLWIVADEDDAATLREPRGSTYTLDEVRIIARIDDQDIIDELHVFKRTFNTQLRTNADAARSS